MRMVCEMVQGRHAAIHADKLDGTDTAPVGVAGPYLPTLNTKPAPTVAVPLAVPPNTRPAFTSMRT